LPAHVRPAPLPDDLAALAAALYGALRDLDAAGVDVVIAALPPAVGLGEAVGDRLRRAAGPRR
jgi:L-threonylcarbamoyladenylate synthase